jgi:hypothetical protein
VALFRWQEGVLIKNCSIGECLSSNFLLFNFRNIGDDVFITKLYVPACRTSEPELRDTFDVVNIRIRRDGGGWTSGNVALSYIEAAECDPDNVTINLL